MTDNPHDNWQGYPAYDPAGNADAYRRAGVEPPWTRVWREGHDVTDEDPATWPWPWSKYWAEGWRPEYGPNAEWPLSRPDEGTERGGRLRNP